jgi:hypothetical protein
MGPYLPRNQRPPSNAVCSHLTVENPFKLIEEGGTCTDRSAERGLSRRMADRRQSSSPSSTIFGDALANGRGQSSNHRNAGSQIVAYHHRNDERGGGNRDEFYKRSHGCTALARAVNGTHGDERKRQRQR